MANVADIITPRLLKWTCGALMSVPATDLARWHFDPVLQDRARAFLSSVYETGIEADEQRWFDRVVAFIRPVAA